MAPRVERRPTRTQRRLALIRYAGTPRAPSGRVAALSELIRPTPLYPVDAGDAASGAAQSGERRAGRPAMSRLRPRHPPGPDLLPRVAAREAEARRVLALRAGSRRSGAQGSGRDAGALVAVLSRSSFASASSAAAPSACSRARHAWARYPCSLIDQGLLVSVARRRLESSVDIRTDSPIGGGRHDEARNFLCRYRPVCRGM